MVSRTKYPIDHAKLEVLFRSAGIGPVENIAPLGAGEYNAVFSARAGDKDYVVKIAPPADADVLTYEKGMMASEIYWYGQVGQHTAIRIPEIYHADFDRKIIPTDFIIMEKLDGEQLDKIKLTDAEKTGANAQVAQMVAQFHKIKNDKFGYIQNGLHDDWHAAIRAMVQAELDDCAKKGKISRRGQRLLAYIDRYKTILKEAGCRMVSFDIWPPNILCEREGTGIRCAWIDLERGFWGDPIMDFVCLEMMTPLPDKRASLAAYNAAADEPVRVTPEECIRYAIAQGYLGVIMEVERYFRYTPRHFGWWRNALASAFLYKNAFAVLKKG